MGDATLKPLNIGRDAANIGTLGTTIGALAKGGGITRAAGAAAIVTGASQLLLRDKLKNPSMLGSAAQTVGGFAMLLGKSPSGQRAGATLAMGGTLAQGIRSYLPAGALNDIAQGVMLGGSAGLALGGHSQQAVGTTLTGASIGAVAGFASWVNKQH